ncbi:ornithine cyclodeaminase family protein [Dehalogenimonas etheniformans]|uniref:Putative alanine dehydrogenase n=1 Tax=Dehalogenimonas etheniformans TaxID=1536648 RepID=A0A2P5P874_9CHLR|nr:ornithine cyclodeaminase family protein [Dehalogenimonas etheniformans]PPD58490.1 ornithine cyclodeaminase family protein [Dehalogenimonas etheniformans]QNT76746.1 ornithine cyclodeaminase family protein [Dehalogenimonas etheniformans]
MSTLLLTRHDILTLITMPETLKAVEQAFTDYALDKAAMPSKAYLTLPLGDFRAMPASVPGAAGLKWVNVHPENNKLGLPTVMAIVVYSDPETGYPLAILDATELTAYRTGAAGAIASKYLARKDANSLGLIGAGKQAQTQLLAHSEFFKFDEIMVFDRSSESAERFKSLFPNYPIKIVSLEQACGADIVCTLTPSRNPFLKLRWLKPGAHVNAIGADAKGKEELEPEVLANSIVVVDDIEQSTHAGELNVPISKGSFGIQNIYATLGELTSGKKAGRSDPQKITVFDSTGLAIQDIATARTIYTKALANQAGLNFDFIQFEQTY